MKSYYYDYSTEITGFNCYIKRIEINYVESFNFGRMEYNCCYFTTSINNPTTLFSKKFVDNYVYYFMLDYINNSYNN